MEKMSTTLETVSKILEIGEDELIENGVRAYLGDERRRLNAEIITIYSKYGVESFEELDDKINRGELDETETFDDFTRLDYLEERRDKVEELLRNLD